MSRSTLRVLAVAGASLALIVMFADTASASWFVEGEELLAGASAALASLPTVDESLILNTPGKGIKIECKGAIHLTNGRIAPPDLAYVGSIQFLSCSTVSPSPTACKLEPSSTSITTTALLALVTGGPSAPEDRLVYKPETGKLLANIPFKEETACALEGKATLNGQVILKALTLGEKHIVQPIEGLGSTENNSLELGTGNKTFVEKGKTLLELKSAEEWLFDPLFRPAILMTRMSGGTGNRLSRCGFNIKGEACELRVLVTNTVGGVALKFIGDKFVKRNGTIEFTEIAPATNPRCTKGTVIGGINTSCYVKIEYTGPNNPAQREFWAEYIAEAQENGGTSQICTDWEELQAKE
jgi:hypothetical protein